MDSASMHFLKKVSLLRQVVDLGGLSEVAQRNKISTSAVSQAISGLEEALDRKLFVRDGGRLAPTQHCILMLASAAPALRAVEEFSQSFHPATQVAPPIAWLDFGVSHCLASELLPRLVKKLRDELPEIRLKLQTGRCQSLLTAVKKGKLCMALATADEIPKGVSSYPVLDDRLGIYFSSERTCSAEAVRNGKFAGVAASTEGHPVYYSRFLRSLGLPPAPALTCDTYESLYDIAAVGIMPAVLPARLANRVKGVLREVMEFGASTQAGRFSVYLFSQKTCDPEEDRFLLRELQSLL